MVRDGMLPTWRRRRAQREVHEAVAVAVLAAATAGMVTPPGHA
jgi:hypothetical protein